jgi:hypothetical protein
MAADNSMTQRILVDRETTCPFLLRVFLNEYTDQHNTVEYYDLPALYSNQTIKPQEIRIHTW